MGYYRTKRNRTGKQKLCPHCNSTMEKVSKDGSDSLYRCISCKSTATIKNEDKIFEKRIKKPAYESIIVLRDRSGEVKRKTKQEFIEDKNIEVPDSVKEIKKGMDEKKLINMVYVSKNGQKGQKTVEPYKIEQDSNGDLIFWGFCIDSRGIRKFFVKSIKNIEITEYDFKPKWPIEIKLKNV